MHGRNKEKYKSRFQDPVASAAIAQKAKQMNLLTKELITRRGKLSPSSSSSESRDEPNATSQAIATLQLTEKILSINPDPSHLWNHRRELLLALETTTTSASEASGMSIEKELKLTATCLQRNPKAYGAWAHRKYCIRHWLLSCDDGSSLEVRRTMLLSELELCGEFLEADERNFHCWNYRRFIVSALALVAATKTQDLSTEVSSKLDLDGSWPSVASNSGTSDRHMGPQLSTAGMKLSSPYSTAGTLDKALIDGEWEFTTQKIQFNFSNYSAFHYRSKLLPLVLPPSSPTNKYAYGDVLALAKSELEIIQNAIFTEPDDQTSWWYHHFIIHWADPRRHSLAESSSSNDCGNAPWDDEYLAFLEEDASTVRELIDMEDGRCKWGLLGLHMLLIAILKLKDNRGEETEDVKSEACGCLRTLEEIDPDRAKRYTALKAALGC